VREAGFRVQLLASILSFVASRLWPLNLREAEFRQEDYQNDKRLKRITSMAAMVRPR